MSASSIYFAGVLGLVGAGALAGGLAVGRFLRAVLNRPPFGQQGVPE